MQLGNIERAASATQFRSSGEVRLDRIRPVTEDPRALGVLILDSKGLVSFCSDALADLVGSSPTEIIGTEIRAFMPGVPLDPATEGYNIAFGAFYAARQYRQTWALHMQNGTVVQVEGYFAMLKMPSGYVFCLELHHHAEHKRIPGPGPAPRNTARKLRTFADAAASKRAAERSQFRLPSKRGQRAVVLRRPLHLLHQPASDLLGTTPAAAGSRTDHSVRSPHVQLLLDREYRVGFASSAIEDLLAHDYEKIIGMHVSDVLPELLPRLGGMCSLKHAKAILRDMGGFISHARHADGHEVPVVVQLSDKKCEQLIPLLLSAPA